MRTVLISGATSGIGKSCVAEFLNAGFRVIAHGRCPTKLEDLTQKFKSSNLLTVQFDLMNIEEMELAVSALEPIHILINNAGVYDRKPWLEHTPEDYDFIFQTNVRAAYFLCKCVIRNLLHHGNEGLILNNSSTLGNKPAPQTSLYAASKAALNSLTQSLAMEFAPQIRAIGVLPGVVDTPIHSKKVTEKELELFYSSISNMHPMGRIGTSQELARLFLTLASKDLSWMTGSLITMDGGISLVT